MMELLRGLENADALAYQVNAGRGAWHVRANADLNYILLDDLAVYFSQFNNDELLLPVQTFDLSSEVVVIVMNDPFPPNLVTLPLGQLGAKIEASLPHAVAEVNAALIERVMVDEQWRADILLWKAYRKSIRPAPVALRTKVANHVRASAKAANIRLDSADEINLAADILGDSLWNALDEAAQREWLVRVEN